MPSSHSHIYLAVIVLVTGLNSGAGASPMPFPIGHQIFEELTAVDDSTKQQTGGDRWLAADKLKHFFGSAMLTGAGYLTMNSGFDVREEPALFVSSGLAFGLGVSKELYDIRHKHHTASFKDLAADILGIGFAFFLISTL